MIAVGGFFDENSPDQTKGPFKWTVSPDFIWLEVVLLRRLASGMRTSKSKKLQSRL
jgi:hypothetical protein